MSKIKIRNRLTVCVLATVIVAFALPADAHHILIEDRDTRGFDSALAIPRPDISWAVYARLEKPDDVDFFSFQVVRPGPIHLGIFIPCRPEFADYYPTYALVGPGLAAPAEKIPFALPAGDGAIVVRSRPASPRDTFFEPFTLTRLYYGVTFTDTEAAKPGEYFMVVWSDRGDYGDYLISYGTAETWSVRDLIDSYKIVARVKGGAWGKFRGRP